GGPGVRGARDQPPGERGRDMRRVYEGSIDGPGRGLAIAPTRFTRLVTDPLVAGAVEELRRHGVEDADVDLAWVPGAFELPLAAERLAPRGGHAAAGGLGAGGPGPTPHFAHAAGQAAAGLAAATRATGVPVAFGVLTCDTMEQAFDRAGGKAGNKGAEAALTALEMAGLLEAIEKEAGSAFSSL